MTREGHLRPAWVHGLRAPLWSCSMPSCLPAERDNRSMRARLDRLSGHAPMITEWTRARLSGALAAAQLSRQRSRRRARRGWHVCACPVRSDAAVQGRLSQRPSRVRLCAAYRRATHGRVDRAAVVGGSQAASPSWCPADHDRAGHRGADGQPRACGSDGAASSVSVAPVRALQLGLAGLFGYSFVKAQIAERACSAGELAPRDSNLSARARETWWKSRRLSSSRM